MTTTDFDRQPTLVGDRVTLRPLRDDDFDALYAIASDPLLWEQHPAKDRVLEPVFRQWMADALASGGALVATNADGRIVATSRYDFHEGEVEIGWTFIARSHWGGTFNAEVKRLMIDHAFDWAQVITLKAHEDNLRSLRAIEKLGAKRVRLEPARHGVGSSVVYELGADTWPAT